MLTNFIHKCYVFIRTEREENQKMAVSSTSTSALSAMHCASSSIDSTSAHINLDQLPDCLSPFKRRESGK